MKFALAILCLGVIVNVNAFGLAGYGAAFPPSQFYQGLLERQLQELLLTPDFPVDLQERAVNVVATAEDGFEQCNSAAYPMPWMQKVCITTQYSRSRSALTAVENEATARAQSSSAAPATEVDAAAA